MRGEVAVLQPVADTSLFELDPDYNFGAQPSLPAGALGRMFPADQDRARALYRFDLSSAVPPRCRIDGAQMRLWIAVRGTPENGRASDFALNRVLVDWGEGAARDLENPGGEEAQAGEATWNNRFHPDQAWSSPGGAFGVDFSDVPAAIARNVTGDRDEATSYRFDFTASGLTELQAMAEGALPNFGWVLHSLDEENYRTARRWTSRETRLTRDGPLPELEIRWSVPAPELAIEHDPEIREVAVSFEAWAGFDYEFQESIDLVTWDPVESVLVTEDGELRFRLVSEESTQFVRVKVSKQP